MKKIIKILLFVTLIISVLTVGFFTYVFNQIKDVKFDESKLTQSKTVCKLYYSNGDKIETVNSNEYAIIDKIPKHVQDAFIAIEDKRFYSHNGIDLKGMARAMKNNLLSGKVKEGGSTISQQLIKNTFLNGEKTLNRKLKEIKLTLEMERTHSKSQILEKYLNTIYFGENAYGIVSASKTYFSKEVENLSIEEGALLASLLKAPTYYNPYKNKDKTFERRNLVLKKMLEQNLISNNEYQKAKSTDIMLNYNNNYDNQNMLVDEIYSEALDCLMLEKTSELYGLKIYTSIDKNNLLHLPSLNDYSLLEDYTILVSENKSGRIVSYYSTVGEIKRCPASTAKPWLIYAPAIEENMICSATKILDEKTNFDNYTPSNYADKYYGYVNVKECLSKSLNVPSVKICNLLGTKKVINYSKKLDVEFSNDDLSIALGNLSGGITVKQLSSCYSVFSDDGKFTHNKFIDKIENSQGKVIYTRNNFKKQVFSDDTAFIINDILNETTKTGTAKKLSSLPYYVCAKTGTNGNKEKNVDAYCVAYTSEHTVVVWIGNKDGSGISSQITGGTFPTMIAKLVFEQLYREKSPKSFNVPKSIVEVKINKELYESDCKIYKNTLSEKEGVSFWFKKGFEPEEMIIKQTVPIIKSYKITCNFYDISFYFEIDKGVMYKIYDQEENELFDSRFDKDFTYIANKKGEYTFFVEPYVFEKGKFIFGKKIKLPSVKVEGNDKILETPWWEE